MKLKTLKDFPDNEFGATGRKFIFEDSLKAEAIRWVKHIESGGEVDCGRVKFKWDKRSQWTGPSGQVLTEWLKNFFNITESDLKC